MERILENKAGKKPSMIFSAQEANDKMNLRLFSKTIFGFFQISPELPPFETWNAG